MLIEEQSDYLRYRGRCKEMSETLVVADPTKDQFPSKGTGEYVDFDGEIECSNCGKSIKEEDADIDGSHAFYSYECHCHFVGVF